MQETIVRDTAFWDKHYSNCGLEIIDIEEKKKKFSFLSFILPDIKGKRILDIGCGNGDLSVFLAKMGGVLYSIDNSQQSVINTLKMAEMNGVQITAEQRDALEIDLIPEHFDYVVGNMILHHIEPLDVFLEKCYFCMNNGAIAIFNENFASSKFLMFFRDNICGKFGVYKASDDYEYPITKEEVEYMNHTFDDIKIETDEFLYVGMLAKNVFRKSATLKRAFDSIDRLIYKSMPWMRDKSYHQIIKMMKKTI